MIAIALVCEPEILIADEPTTALDVTIQAQILDLFKEIQKKTDVSIILITHDLGVVAQVADRIAVMYAGKIVEEGTRREIFYQPQHPYTKGLLQSVPRLDLIGGELVPILGSPLIYFHHQLVVHLQQDVILLWKYVIRSFLVKRNFPIHIKWIVGCKMKGRKN